MTTYATQDASAEGGSPVELYKFTQLGSTETYRYTSSNEPFTYDAEVYTPVVLSRSEPKLSPKMESGSIKITVPRDLPFVTRYLAPLPPLPEKLIIYRTHSTDTSNEVIVFWQGDIEAVAFKEDKAIISTSTLMGRLGGVIPKRNFSWMCNHVLFDDQCKVDKTAFFAHGVVQSVDKEVIVVADSLGTFDPLIGPVDSATVRFTADPLFFNGGYLKYTDSKGLTHHRSIISFTQPGGGDSLVLLNHQILELAGQVGGAVEMYAGCSHSVNVCYSKFNNVLNYGGFPLVPLDNPFSTGIVEDGKALGPRY